MAKAREAITVLGIDSDGSSGFVLDRSMNGAAPTIDDLPWLSGRGAQVGNVPPAGEPSQPQTIPQTYQIGGNIAAGANTLTIFALYSAEA